MARSGSPRTEEDRVTFAPKKKPRPSGNSERGEGKPLPEGYDMNQFKGECEGGELLLTEHDDGTREIAFRPDQWATWGRPTKLFPVPAEEVVAP